MPDFTRAAASTDLVTFVQRRYELAELRPVRDLGGGYNLNLLVNSDCGALVVRVYGGWVLPERLTAIQDVREHLRVRNWPIAPLLQTPDGAGTCLWNDRPVEVERFMAGGTRMNSWPLLTAGMRILAQLHDAMRTAPVAAAARTAPIANHVPAASVVDVTAPAIATIRGLGLTDAEERYVCSAERLADRLQAVADVHLPTRLVHGDFWDNNVYFDETRPVRIGDFDFMGERARIDDLALTMFFAGEHFGRQDPTSERLDHLRALVAAFDGALTDGLTADERMALPYAIARSPLTFLRDMAQQGRPALDELRNLRGPEYDWANRMLDSPVWLGAFG